MVHPDKVGKYELEKFLGGGMARVYRAKDTVLGRRVAVKILTDAGMADPEAKARFLQEARMASNIHHENIISIYDFGEDEGRPFIVMEFLEGESLRDVIKNGHAGPLKQRLRVALQVARALDYIHSRKIIHRDVKPENIHVDASGKARLMDFGIAKSDNLAITRAGFTVGTPFYMAPEQVLGRPLTPQADVYAFGILLYELLTEAKPVSGENLDAVFQAILYKQLDPGPLDAAQVPEPARALIARCTAKQLIQRAQNLSVVGDEIEQMMEPMADPPPRHTPPPPGLLSPSNQHAHPEVRLPMPPPPPGLSVPPRDPRRMSDEAEGGGFFRSPIVVMILMALAVVALALGAYALLARSGTL